MRKALAETKKAADAAAKNATVAEQTLHLTQTADVHITAITLTPDGRLSMDTVIVVEFKNFGATRATHFTNTLGIGLDSESYRLVSEPRSDIAMVIGSGQPLPWVWLSSWTLTSSCANSEP
jgi:hypothetical protein